MRRLIIIALASAAFAGTAPAQTSVDIRTGPNGQLSGSATAGSVSTGVSTGSYNGNPVPDRTWSGQGARSEAHCSGNGRTMTVTSPDGSSSSSVSSSGDGTVSVGGGGSPGSRVRYRDCDGPTGRAYGQPATTGYSSAGRGGTYTSVSTSGGSAVMPHHRTVRHHRKRRAHRR